MVVSIEISPVDRQCLASTAQPRAGSSQLGPSHGWAIWCTAHAGLTVRQLPVRKFPAPFATVFAPLGNMKKDKSGQSTLIARSPDGELPLAASPLPGDRDSVRNRQNAILMGWERISTKAGFLFAGFENRISMYECI